MPFTVYAQDRAVLADVERPEDLLTWVPGAEPLMHEGRQLVALPHTLGAAIWLAQMGYDAPSPIEDYYQWPRDETIFKDVFEHQIDTARFLTANPRAYCLNQIGTMKTITALWAADYLMQEGVIGPVYVIAPMESLERAWGDTVFYHLRHRKHAVLHGSKAKRLKRLESPADFYIINPDGLPVIEEELAARTDIKLCIIDELADFRNKTNAWRSLNRILYPAKRAAMPWVWGLTGTPRPKAPTDVFHQCKLVTPTTVPKYFGQFRSLCMEPGRMDTKTNIVYEWKERPEANRIVFNVMRPAIRYNRDECLDLPGEIYSTLDVDLSAEQQKHYKELMKELYTEVRGGKVTAINEGVKLMKLAQIACGVVYSVDGTPIEIDASPRIEVLLSTIERINEKVICFVPFTNVTDMLYREVSKHWSAAVVYGDIPTAKRNQIFDDFQRKPDPSVLIAHPGCMSRALTLTEASTIIWYAPIDSNYTYEQANGRVTRQGQKYVANLIHLAGSVAERKAYKRLELRQKMQGLLLEMVERGEQ